MFEDLFKMFAMDADYAYDDILDDFDQDEDGTINLPEWKTYSKAELKKLAHKENEKLQKQMNAFRITLEDEYSPTSRYYTAGKLGILESSDLKAFDLCF